MNWLFRIFRDFKLKFFIQDFLLWSNWRSNIWKNFFVSIIKIGSSVNVGKFQIISINWNSVCSFLLKISFSTTLQVLTHIKWILFIWIKFWRWQHNRIMLWIEYFVVITFLIWQWNIVNLPKFFKLIISNLLAIFFNILWLHAWNFYRLNELLGNENNRLKIWFISSFFSRADVRF